MTLRLSGEQGHRCGHCQGELTFVPLQKNTVTLDHMIPLSRGGSNHWFNLIVACWQCNNDRGDTMPDPEIVAIMDRAAWMPKQIKNVLKKGKVVSTRSRRKRRR